MMAMQGGHSGEFNSLEPVWGGVLIGGKSSRMGTPKHLLEKDGMTWLELILNRLQERVEEVVISGSGKVPDSLGHIPVVKDVPGLCGPLAGILALLKKYPGVSWLVVACDMPDVDIAALDWLLGLRGYGVKAILPDLEGKGQVEPLLAYYSSDSLVLLEEISLSGSLRPGAIVGKQGVVTPEPPASLRSSWTNFNSLKDLNR